MKKEPRIISQEYSILNVDTIDKIVLLTQDYAKKSKIDAASASKYAFLIDNVLDYWLNHGAKDKEIKFTLGRKLFCPTVSIELEGEKLDPYDSKYTDFGEIGKDIIVSSGQVPEYEYINNRNIITIKLTRQHNIILTIGLVCIVAFIIGIFGNIFLSDPTREMLLELVIGPILDMFFNILRCIAGPMVFLSVVWGICGIGDSRLFGKVGKNVLLYSFWITLLGAFIGAAASFFFKNGFTSEIKMDGDFNSLFKMILNIAPSSIVDPFSTGNTLQIIFLAIAVGIALISMSQKASKIVVAVDQFNNVVQYLMKVISKIVPLIVFLLLVNIIWSKTFELVYSTWKFFVVLIAMFVAISLIMCAITSICQKTKFFTIAKNNLSSFIIALTTASSAAAFSSNMKVATEKYGISNDLSGFSIPLGMIVHNPIAACYNIVLVIYFANVYGVSCSIGWLIIGIIVSTIVAISSPPIPGGAVVSYSLLFSQMGIPEEALALALVLDVVTDFIVTAFECYVLPISMTNISSKLGRINKDVLKQ